MKSFTSHKNSCTSIGLKFAKLKLGNKNESSNSFKPTTQNE